MSTKAPPSDLSALGAIDIAHLLHPYTNLEAHEARGPFVITRGEGVYVFDQDGKQYLEGMAGLWCTALGFSEPRTQPFRWPDSSQVPGKRRIALHPIPRRKGAEIAKENAKEGTDDGCDPKSYTCFRRPDRLDFQRLDFNQSNSNPFLILCVIFELFAPLR